MYIHFITYVHQYEWIRYIEQKLTKNKGYQEDNIQIQIHNSNIDDCGTLFFYKEKVLNSVRPHSEIFHSIYIITLRITKYLCIGNYLT